MALLFSGLATLTALAGEPSVIPDADLAFKADSIVVARIGSLSASPQETGGAAALWIEHTLKGKLRAGRDIIWLPRKELPGAQLENKLWLLCLSQRGDGTWHIQSGGREPLKIDSVDSPKVAELAKAAGAFGAAPEAEAPSAAEFSMWIRKAAKGSQQTRREASARLLAAGDAARTELLSALSSDEREVANVARTLLPLTGGGPAVNKLRLVFEPANLELQPGDLRNIVVHFANLDADDMKFVLGQSAWGETVEAAAVYRVRALKGAGTEEPRTPQLFSAVLPQGYGKPRADGASSLPLVRVAPGLSTLPVAIRIELEKATEDGKEIRRLKFPHGSISVPGPGRYGMRVTFECPGPRPDQQRLIDANYWGGGRLISNEITLVIK